MDDIAQFGQHLRQLRQQQRISQRALAEAAGIALSFLSKVESGKASPTLATMMKLAEALNISIVELLAPSVPDPQAVTVVPVAQMAVVDDGDKRWRYLFPHHPRIHVIMSDEVYQPQTRHVEMEQHPHDVCGVVLSGVLTLEMPTHPTRLVHPGESFYIKAGTPHMSRNATDDPIHLISVELPDTGRDAAVIS